MSIRRRSDESRIVLPGGIWRDGAREQEAWLRPLTGADERFVVERGTALRGAACTTALLARAVTRLGGLPSTSDAIRLLTAGDREALLLELRRLTLGDRLDGVFACPAPGCRELMDVPLRVGQLLTPAYTEWLERYEAAFLAEGRDVRVTFRLPTGIDQEAAADLALSDLAGAANLLMHRCLDAIQVDGRAVADLPAAAASVLGELMAGLDPQAELLLALSCPACGAKTSALFDAGAYFRQELTGRRSGLDREVHILALHYHWSESDILRLTPTRRRTYLELISGVLTETQGAA